MRSHLTFLFIVLFFSLFFVINSEAIPTCTFRTTCNGDETCIFEVLQENNTHVGSCDSPYTTKICCTEITSAAIRSSCNAGEGGVISMYATSNAHAGRKDYYTDNIVCAKTSGNLIVSNMRSACLARENCAFSVFQQNNTHAASCNYYDTKVCIQELFNMTITILMNNTEPNWNDFVSVTGNVTRSDGSYVDTSGGSQDVELFINGTRVCGTDTNSTGGYTCNFTAASAVGLYLLNVTVNDTTTSVVSFNTTTFSVKQAFGETKPTESAAESVACYEEPRVIQNPDGTIEVAIVRICVFK